VARVVEIGLDQGAALGPSTEQRVTFARVLAPRGDAPTTSARFAVAEERRR